MVISSFIFIIIIIIIIYKLLIIFIIVVYYSYYFYLIYLLDYYYNIFLLFLLLFLFNFYRQITKKNQKKAFFIIKPEQFKLAIDSIVWAFKHPIKNISDIGLLTLYQLWVNIQHSEIAPAFYQTFLLSLLNDLLTVLTDSFHKSGSFPFLLYSLSLFIFNTFF